MLHINVRGVFLSIQAAVPNIKMVAAISRSAKNVAISTGVPGASVYQFTPHPAPGSR